MESAIERREQIAERLRFRRKDTVDRLAAEFGVCIRTIKSDIMTLSLSYPITTVQGFGGGVVWRGKRPAAVYTEREVEAIRNAFNRQYCRENNIAVLHSPVAVTGGTVVFSVGDLTFNYVTKDAQSDWLGAVRQGICEYLAGKGLNATLDKNDILIDGKKVSGGSAGIQGGMRVESLFFAVVSSAELIEKICLKKRTKQPASLQEYGITAQEIQAAVVDLTKRYMGAPPKKKEKPRGKRTLRDVLGNVKVSKEQIRRFQGVKPRAPKGE